MSYSYKVDSFRNISHVVMTGEPDEREVLELYMAFVADSRVQPGFRCLADLSNASFHRLTLNIMLKLSALEREHRDKFLYSRTAIVSPDSFAWTLGSAFLKITSRSVLIFASHSVAVTWLGCDPTMITDSPLPPPDAKPSS